MNLRNKIYSPARALKPFLIVLLLTFGIKGFAQELNEDIHSFNENWVMGINLGFSQFYGDASNSGYFDKFSGQLGFAAGIAARKMIKPGFGLGLNFQYAGLNSKKLFNSVGQPVNIGLKGSYFDFNFFSYIDFISLFRGYNKERVFSIYSTLGIGPAFWGSTLNDYDSGYVYQSGQSYNGINYHSAGFSVPFGVGINLKLGSNVAITIEGNLRTALNDDVDVWRDGFIFDQNFLTTVGISYYIKYGFAKKKKKNPCDCDDVVSPPLKSIDLYDYDKKSPSRSSRVATIKPVQEKASPVVLESKIKTTQGIVFRIQILAKRTKLPDLTLFKKKYGITEDVHENHQDGVYRYSIGYFRNYQNALSYSHVIKNKGVFDAFVVVYKDNIRIPLTPELKK